MLIARTSIRSAIDAEATTKSSCRVAVTAVCREWWNVDTHRLSLGSSSSPWLGPAAVRVLGSDDMHAERRRALEHRVIARLPVHVGVLAVPSHQIPVADHDQTMISPSQKHRRIRQDSVGRAFGITPVRCHLPMRSLGPPTTMSFRLAIGH